ncbi:MAG: hypothetical protein D6675_14325 [Gemmatimonadetes bacterium]|nr:MAG: hypothetical protein D6675_14325 [Gemmatimonadota bacterium]
MCQLFETLKVEHRVLHNVESHNQRLNRARQERWGCTGYIDLRTVIHLPEDFPEGLHKCRVTYRQDIESIEFVPYTVRRITRLKLVPADTIHYAYKFVNRAHLNQLKRMARCGPTEEIIIIKNGWITDTTYSNLAFFDGKRWFTPAFPLLRGTQRERLLQTGQIYEAQLRPRDLNRFITVKLINAMLDLETSPAISIHQITR